MAVPAGPTEKRYIGNGVTTIFTIPFLLLASTDLDVFIDGVEISTGFVITGAGNPTSTITFTVAPADQADVYLQLNVPFERLNDYQENGDFLASTVNRDFDRIWQALKQLLLGASRALTLGKTDVDGSGNYQAKGNGIANLRDPVNDQDAVTKGWLITYLESFAGAVISTVSIAYDTFTLFDFLRFWNARAVDSIADLRLLSSARNQKAVTYGYYAKGDGGGGSRYYVDESDTTSVDNGCTVIVGTDGARWKLSWSGTLYVRRAGARGIGTDDTAALQAAINSGAKKLKYTPGTYGLGAAGLTMVSLQKWVGTGFNFVTIKMLVPPTKDMVYATGKTGVSSRGICFDGNGKLTAGVGNYPSLLPCVHVSECSDVDFTKNKFIGFYNCGLLGNVITTGKFRKNYLNRGSAATFINHGIGISGESSNIDIDDNDCLFCQISINAINSGITDNRVSGWGFSAGINTQATSSCYNLKIDGNFCYNSNQANDVSPYSPQGIENWAPNSIITNNTCYGCFGDGIGNGGKNTLIKGNNCFNNKGYGIFNVYQDATYNASGSLVDGNNLYDTRVGVARTQTAGYAEQAGGLTGIMFSNNPCTNNLGPNVYNCTARATAAQYDWTPVTAFTNSWVDFAGGGFSQTGYYKDTNGIVRLRGSIKSGTVGTAAFLLPAGFRPAGDSNFACVSNNLFGFVIVNAGGAVIVQAGSNSYVSLDGISFRAA